MTPALDISGLVVTYDKAPALRGVSIALDAGEIVALIGANGAGKTTIIKPIMGLLKAQRGTIRFDGEHDLLRLRPHQIHRLGIAWVPEGRQLWNTMTVLDNLRMGAFEVPDEDAVNRRIGEMFERFPRLAERRHQLAGSLSGGEQQLVAIARALVSSPRLLLMDEPSLGLAPIVVRDVFTLAQEINRLGIAVLMVEQNARQSLKVAHSAYLLELGRVVEAGPAAEIAGKKSVQEVFLGGSA